MDANPSNGGKGQRSYALNGKIMLSAIVVLFTVILLILFLHLYVRWHVIHRASRLARRRRRLVFSGEGQILPPSAVNRGLEPSILASLPILLFSTVAGYDGDEEMGESDCAVCLNVLSDGEKIRCLPRCGHRFHLDCIDMWFFSNSTCPLCRAAVEAVVPASISIPAGNSAAAMEDSRELDFRFVCRREVEIGSSSSDSRCRGVKIEVPARIAECLSGQEEQLNLGFESPEEQPGKHGSSRMVLIRWLLMRDPRLQLGGVSASDMDLERGDGATPTAPPPPPPPPPPPSVSTRYCPY